MSTAAFLSAASGTGLLGEPDDDGCLVDVECGFAHGVDAQYTQSPPRWRGQPWEIDGWRAECGPDWQTVASVTNKDAADAALRLLSIGEEMRDVGSFTTRIFRTGDDSDLRTNAARGGSR